MIVDDEIHALGYLKMLCEQFPFIEVVKCFDSPVKLVEEHRSISFDLCLLDINMPGLSGLEVAKALEEKAIVFVSAHPQFAIEAFEVEALDFIKKPVTRERLEKAFQKAQKKIEQPAGEGKSYLSLNTNLGKSVIFFDDLLFIATSDIDKRDKVAALADGRTIIFKNITIDKLLAQLPAYLFVQVNKAEIVARKVIQSVATGEIALKVKHPVRDTQTAVIGETYGREFRKWLG